MKERQIFTEALERPPGQARDEYLAEACAGNDALRVGVEHLLVAHVSGGNAQHRDASGSEQPRRSDEKSLPGESAGDRIGRYQLLQRIGEGGMGTVWMAEQREPVRRQVALKLIKLGMDTKEVVARFEAERQALALMDHPNIARVIDGGATVSGRPYFVMEYIRGVPILEFCDKEKLSTEARLDLFVQVCNAIQHAHQKGIIHRDIKPTNVLVTLHEGVPVPKVIDFGIAKATGGALTARTLFTEHGQMIGTPAYMSPEQAGMTGLDIDTRSDIYSLGVLLYELLTGTTPFDIRELLERGFGEMVRAICEETPHKPSTRIANLGETAVRTALQRRVDVRRLGTELRGDLDWIVMRCLEKDRTRRYDSASDLAADIGRHRNHEAVNAGPPSRIYRLTKFVRRNRGTVLAGALLALALLVGAIGTTRGMLLAQEQRLRADAEAGKAVETARFALSLFRGIGPEVARGADTTLLSGILDDAKERITRELSGQPEVEAEIRTTLGRAYLQLTRFDEAERELRRAEQLLLELFGEQDRRMLDTRNALADLLLRRGQHADAEKLQRQTLAQQQMSLGTSDRDALATQRDLGASLMRQGKFREAEELLRDTLAVQREVFGGDDAETLATEVILAQTLGFMDRSREACDLLRNVHETRRARLGDDSPDTIAALDSLASAQLGMKQYAESEATHRAALERATRVFGPEGQETLSVINNLALCLAAAGNTEEAESLYRRCLEIRRRKLGEEHVDTLSSINNLASLLWSLKRYSEAGPLFEQAFETERRVLGDDHRLTMQARFNLASGYKMKGDYARSAELLGQIVEHDRRMLTPDDPKLALDIYNWAGTLQEAGEMLAAEVPLREAAALVQKHGMEAEPFVPATWNALAKSLTVKGEYSEADRYFAMALESRRKRYSAAHPEIAYSLNDWGMALVNRGEFERAEPLLQELLDVERKVSPSGGWRTARAEASCGRCLSGMGRFAQAEPLLLAACNAYGRFQAPGDNAANARRWIIELYEAWDAAEPGKGIAARAEAWRTR